MMEYEDYFKKIHHFKNDELYTLPSKTFESPKWCVPELQNKKVELNDVKGLLGKYKLKVWSKHTANRDPSGFVMKKLAESVQPELLTQAWCKFYEILGQFPVIPQKALVDEKFCSIHLCEAPGAFVCALNHYLGLNHPQIKWNWTANTLNPNYEGNELSQMIPDDRLIRYTIKNWYFGLDFTGDITKYYNHQKLVETIGNDKVDLVTADGSVDCMKDPGEQERHVEYLHFCETISALAVLETGGTFILKIFTIFEDTTINLMFFLNCLFEKVSIFKPCTSKSGNSEVYVVSTNFKGINILSNIWHQLISVYDNPEIFSSYSMFSQYDLPKTFMDDIIKCVDFFKAKQTYTILRNIYHFDNKDKFENHRIYMLKSSVAQHYISLYNVQWIPNDKKIVPNISIGDNWRVHSTQSTKGFTCVITKNMLKYGLSRDIIDIIIGKRIDVVQNSKFIQKDHLQKILFGFNSTNNSELYNLAFNHLKNSNEIINIKEFCSREYHDFQRQFFYRLYNSLGTSNNIIFMNIPFHTHFLVGILYILFYAFEKVYFGHGVIILCKCKIESINKVKDVLSLVEEQYNELKDNERQCSSFVKDIVQIISPCFFDETYSSFVGLIWNYNNRMFLKNVFESNSYFQFY